MKYHIMKNTKLILLLTAANIFGSCQKEDSALAVSKVESFRDLQVSSSFDWKTTQELNVSAVLPDNGELQALIITNTAGTETYFSGYPDDGSRTVNTKITVPSYLKELRLLYNGIYIPGIVSIANGSMSYDFNTGNKSGSSYAASVINFGSMSNFAIFTGAGAITATGPTAVSGNVGTGAGAVTGIGLSPSTFTGSIEIANPVTTQGIADLNVLIGGVTALATTNATHPVIFGNETLYPGVYNVIAGASSITPAQTLTLDAQGNPNALFVIRVSGAFGMGADATVALINGAAAGNVFLYATGAITLAANTTVVGNLIANVGAISMGAGCSVDGRLLSTVGAISGSGFTLTTPDANPVIVAPAASTSGTLAFEDLWPAQGDYDFNDLVVGYDFSIIKDNQEIVQSMTATFTVQAYGASFNNGFGFTLPTVSAADIVSVTGYDVQNSTVFSIGNKGLENGQTNATIIVFDDVRRIMPQVTGGIGVNTQSAYAYTAPVTVTVEIVFSGNLTYSQLNIGSFNPFLIVGTSLNQAPGTGSRGKEVHLANYPPSDLFDTNLFGTASDNSSPNIGRYFVTPSNLPSAINIAGGFSWPNEAQDIIGAYTNFGPWAQGAPANANWYLDLNGNISSGATFTIPGN
jgi:LruC domain-containing protein